MHNTSAEPTLSMLMGPHRLFGVMWFAQPGVVTGVLVSGATTLSPGSALLREIKLAMGV